MLLLLGKYSSRKRYLRTTVEYVIFTNWVKLLSKTSNWSFRVGIFNFKDKVLSRVKWDKGRGEGGGRERKNNNPTLMVSDSAILTRWMIPAAVNHTLMKMDINWAKRIVLLVLSMLRYCRISGTVINRSARKNLRPAKEIEKWGVTY